MLTIDKMRESGNGSKVGIAIKSSKQITPKFHNESSGESSRIDRPKRVGKLRQLHCNCAQPNLKGGQPQASKKSRQGGE